MCTVVCIELSRRLAYDSRRRLLLLGSLATQDCLINDPYFNDDHRRRFAPMVFLGIFAHIFWKSLAVHRGFGTFWYEGRVGTAWCWKRNDSCMSVQCVPINVCCYHVSWLHFSMLAWITEMVDISVQYRWSSSSYGLQIMCDPVAYWT